MLLSSCLAALLPCCLTYARANLVACRLLFDLGVVSASSCSSPYSIYFVHVSRACVCVCVFRPIYYGVCQSIWYLMVYVCLSVTFVRLCGDVMSREVAVDMAGQVPVEVRRHDRDGVARRILLGRGNAVHRG